MPRLSFSRRNAFTLLELLIVFAILATLLTLVGAATMKAVDSQKNKSSQLTKRLVSETVQKEMTQTVAKADKEVIPAWVFSQAGNDPRRARAIYRHLRLKQRFPESFREAMTPSPLPPEAGMVAALERQSITADTVAPAEVQSSACLLAALELFAQDFVGHLPTGTVRTWESGEMGLSCRVLEDARRNLITLEKWPVGTAADLESRGARGADLTLDPDGLLSSPSWANSEGGRWFRAVCFGSSTERGLGENRLAFAVASEKATSLAARPPVRLVQAADSPKGSPSSMTVPFYGLFYGSSSTVPASDAWFDLTGSSAHVPFATFDDTNAYDFNLSYQKANLPDPEQALPAVAVAKGTVTSLGTTFPGTTAGGTYGAVLIDHGNDWFTGYMHLKDITVKSGDAVSAGQEIGKIWNTGVKPIHLHFSSYTRTNQGTATKPKWVLVSKKVSFNNRDFNLSGLPSKVEVNKSKTYQVSATVPFFGGKNKIESDYYSKNTWWSSSNTTVAKVDGYGKITGVAPGKADISVKCSGKVFTIPVTVK